MPKSACSSTRCSCARCALSRTSSIPCSTSRIISSFIFASPLSPCGTRCVPGGVGFAVFGLSEKILYLRPVHLLRQIPPPPGGKRQFVDLGDKRCKLALEGERWI